MPSKLDAEIFSHFQAAVKDVDAIYGNDSDRLDDLNASAQLRTWLDGTDIPLPWANPNGDVTADEWFFVTTLYGTMTLAGQRTHIRKFFPALFVGAAKRDIRNFTPDMPEYAGLRQNWMRRRLSRMGEILRGQNRTMGEYVEHLRDLEKDATPHQPMPALDRLLRDHNAGEGKTLSVFVRDYVGGNCFPIDSRVAKFLASHGLPNEPNAERMLVSASLASGRNPRMLARMFYEAGGPANGAST